MYGFFFFVLCPLGSAMACYMLEMIGIRNGT